MASKPKLGSGKRFKQLTAKLRKRGVKNPKALAAYIGRKKYGKKKFQQLAAKGRRKWLRKLKVLFVKQYVIYLILFHVYVVITVNAKKERTGIKNESRIISR